MSQQRNLSKPKKHDTQSARDTAEAKAGALLSEAVRNLERASAEEAKVSGLESSLAALRKKKARHYWEAGRLLTEARNVAPHGTWTRLLKDADLPPVQDHGWRLLYEQFPDPGEIEDIKITDALALAKARKADGKQSIDGPSDTRGTEASEDDSPHGRETPAAHSGSDLGGFRIWTEAKEGLPIVHAVRVGQRGWTPLCRIQWGLDLPPFTHPPVGEEQDVNCPRCIGKLAAYRAEVELREAARRPHGSEIGYVWEILEGDDPDAIDARWLPIQEIEGEKIITPEKTFDVGEPVYRDKFEALEATKAKYQHLVEQDQAEIERLKAQEDRLKEEKRLAEKRLKRIEALLEQEA
jgi:hypothetical protein